MLFVHDRQTRKRVLPLELTLALENAFFSDRRVASDLTQARALLTDLHHDRAWLACDCASGPEDTWPMIGPRDGRGGIHPFRFGSVSHKADCPFAASIRHVDESVHDASEAIDGDWHLQTLFPLGQSSVARHEALSRLLRTALMQLGFDRLHISAFDKKWGAKYMRLLETPYSRLRHLGAQPMGEGRTFRDIGLTFLPALPRLLRKLRNSMKHATGVVGLYLGVIDMAEVPDRPGGTGFLTARNTTGDRRTFPFHGNVFLPSGDNGQLGPYWALTLVVRTGEGNVHLGDTLILSALDRRTLLPVPSHAHRAVAKMLLEQMHFWRSWKKLLLDVELATPLFPSPYPITPAFSLVMPNQARVPVDLDNTNSFADGGVSVPANNVEGMRRRLTAAVARAMVAA